MYCRYFTVTLTAVIPENSYAPSVEIRTQAPLLEPDHDPTCAMARLIASRVMPSLSCFAINAR